MKTKIKKEFDCVESVRKSRARIAKETEGKSAKEVLEYFKKRNSAKANNV
ncbi:MAG: hypothetical protein RJQ05_06930 [Cytophagales bacterium]